MRAGFSESISGVGHAEAETDAVERRLPGDEGAVGEAGDAYSFVMCGSKTTRAGDTQTRLGERSPRAKRRERKRDCAGARRPNSSG